MRLEDIEAILREHKAFLIEKYNVSKLGVFGSFVRDQQTETSDVDILVEFSRPLGFEFIDLKEYLELILSRPVDLVTKKSLKEYIKEDVLREVRYQ